MMFNDKVVLVTGGSSGIGKKIAEKFSGEGARVIAAGLREESDAGVKYISTDVRDEDKVRNLIGQVVEEYGRIDVLVNSAGVYSQNQWDIPNLSLEEFDDTMNTNFKGIFLMTKHALPHILKSKGNIVNISSALGLVPEKESSIYCSSKAAVNMFTKTLALNYADKGIRINAVCPGPIDTPMLSENIPSDEMGGYLNNNPMRRAGTTDEVANLALFLASEKASYITGGLYTIDGGESLK